MMKSMSIRAVASAFPEAVVTNSFFGEDDVTPKGGMFMGAVERRHMSPDETAVELIRTAIQNIAEQVGEDVIKDVDYILTNVSLPDMPFTGCGAEVARAIGANPIGVYDLHNHGCISFITMMSLAQSLLSTSGGKRALICNAQTTGGRIFSDKDVRKLPQAAIPGDGCGVALLEVGEGCSVQTVAQRCFSEFSSDMQISSPDGRNWWEPGEQQFYVDFSRAKIAKIVQRGNQMVPQIVQEACKQANIKTDEIGTLITNQPNPIFLRNWREALQVDPENHIDTFQEYGNLFGAGIPVSLERAQKTGKLKNGSYVVLGGFSHAGDYAAAAVIRWNAA